MLLLDVRVRMRLVQPLFFFAQPVLGPMLLQTCASSAHVLDSDGQSSVPVGQVLCPQSFAVFECPMILILTP